MELEIQRAQLGFAAEGCHEIRPLHGGVQARFRFPNGYGASVVRHHFSYGYEAGLWELAVLRLVKGDWELCYTTPITDDVLGSLTPGEVDDLLRRISQL